MLNIKKTWWHVHGMYQVGGPHIFQAMLVGQSSHKKPYSLK